MKEIFEQYGGAILVLVVIVALIAIVSLLLAAGEGGVVYDALKELIEGLGKQ